MVKSLALQQVCYKYLNDLLPKAGIEGAVACLFNENPPPKLDEVDVGLDPKPEKRFIDQHEEEL